MKTKHIIIALTLLISIGSSAQGQKAETISTGLFGKTDPVSVLTIRFEKGKAHNHPLMAFWLADEDGKYIQTLYVAESIGKGVFRRVDRSSGKWQSGEIQRPASLPYWAHQRGVKNAAGNYMPTPATAVPDAYTGATPIGSFEYHLITDKKLNGKYKVFMEINQSWDWNQFWHNNKFPDDKEYRTSSQPALVYEATIDTNKSDSEFEFRVIGHSHYAGADGKLYTDLSGFSTALDIVKHCVVKLTP